MSPVKLKMHFHFIFECKFALLCARFLHIFLLNFDRIFDDFRQILGRRGTSEASGATSWHLGGVQVRIFSDFWRLQGLILEPLGHPWDLSFDTLTSLYDTFLHACF